MRANPCSIDAKESPERCKKGESSSPPHFCVVAVEGFALQHHQKLTRAAMAGPPQKRVEVIEPDIIRSEAMAL